MNTYPENTKFYVGYYQAKSSNEFDGPWLRIKFAVRPGEDFAKVRNESSFRGEDWDLREVDFKEFTEY